MFVLIAFMVGIGAVIGGLTNSLAIKMLFRPYKEIRIGAWRVPFTPGLIPKRRDELASQLGRTVVDYLITAEGLGKKLKSSQFSDSMIAWVERVILTLLRSEERASTLIEKHLGVENPKQQLVDKTSTFIHNAIHSFFETKRNENVETILPKTFQKGIEGKIPVLAAYILTKGQDYVSSSEGKEQISIMIDRFLVQKGTLGNMISMFLGNARLVDKVQPELVKLLEDDGTKELLETLLKQEWEKVKQKKVAHFEQYIGKGEVTKFIVEIIEKEVPVYEWIDQPLNTWTHRYEGVIMKRIIPKSITLLLDMLAIHLEDLLQRFHLDQIVKEQVEAFSIERIEELVISITKRELKMITYLGALLGGIIGFIQSIVVMVIG